jgi:hypothetical protein
MKKPSDDDLLLAAEWLDSNEGEADESEPMKRVAEWLRNQVNQRRQNAENRAIIDELVKASGCTRAYAKKFWEKRKRQEKI